MAISNGLQQRWICWLDKEKCSDYCYHKETARKMPIQKSSSHHTKNECWIGWVISPFNPEPGRKLLVKRKYTHVTIHQKNRRAMVHTVKKFHLKMYKHAQKHFATQPWYNKISKQGTICKLSNYHLCLLCSSICL